MTDARAYAPAAARNREPILAVLQRVLPAQAKVLEIASGSGEHAVFFARAMHDWRWQPSDPDAPSRASIAAWIETEALTNVLAPRDIDVRETVWGVEGDAPFDAIVSCNMIHISPWASALGLIAGAARLVKAGGVLFLYGPFMRGGVHTAPSNAAFDVSLKARNPEWGVRDLDVVACEAADTGFVLSEIVDMPANNLSVVFRRA